MNNAALDLEGNHLSSSTLPGNEDSKEGSLCGSDLRQRSLSVECINNLDPDLRSDRKTGVEVDRKEYWKQKRLERRAKKRVVAASRKAVQNAEWEQLTEDERNARRVSAVKSHEEKRRANELFLETSLQRLADPELPVLVFDLSFAWCMSLPDTKSTVLQLKFSYSTLRRAGFPFRPFFSSLIGKEKQDTEHDASEQARLLQAALIDFEGFKKFSPIISLEQHWSELFDREKVVFLTADADEVLEDIQPGHIYIIGAFVDHNRYKALSKTRAQAHGVRTARLPIKESIDLQNRSVVLTINHLVEVLTSYVLPEEGSTRDWARALDMVLPVRRKQQEVLGSRKRRRQKQNSMVIPEENDEHANCEGNSLDRSS